MLVEGPAGSFLEQDVVSSINKVKIPAVVLVILCSGLTEIEWKMFKCIAMVWVYEVGFNDRVWRYILSGLHFCALIFQPKGGLKPA